jgi:dynein heavy chain
VKDEVHEAYKQEVEAVKSNLDLFQNLGNQSMQPRHWQKVFKLLGGDGAQHPNFQMRTFTFSQLLEEGVEQHKERVEEISGQATGEHNIENGITEITDVWDSLPFVVLNYRDSKDRFLLSEIDDVIVQLEDHQMSVQTMMANRHVGEVRGSVERWEKKLSYISDVIEEWLAFQRQWMYLENIFNAEDIQKQLPAEAKSF